MLRRTAWYPIHAPPCLQVSSALMLAHAATPGWRGALKDFTRVLGGELPLLGLPLRVTFKQSNLNMGPQNRSWRPRPALWQHSSPPGVELITANYVKRRKINRTRLCLQFTLAGAGAGFGIFLVL